jgi:alkanesulfonate monooxygenase SsuD/methylene tetrahydromethanopterin reductase-like flavin-dependent oxidoreductase (luciferase family)
VVHVGLLLSDVPASVPPDEQFRDVLRIVAEAQEQGFTYVAIGQHFLYGDLRWLQPVPLLARLAAEVAPEVRLVTQIMIAPLYHPVLLAEEVATLDIVTEGRLVFGAGLGYRPEEFDYFGVPYQERAGRMDEALDLMTRLWTEDEVTFHGTYVTLDAVQPHLRPVQQPHPPIWIGGFSLAGARRAGRFGDAFACPPEMPAADAAERYAQRGLDVMADTDLEHDFAAAVAGHAVVGTPDEVTAELLHLAATLPVDPILLRPQWPSMSADEAVAAIRRLGREVVPALREAAPATEAVLRPPAPLAGA